MPNSLRDNNKQGFEMGQSVAFGECRLREDGMLVTPNGSRQLSRRLAVILRELVEARGIAVNCDHLLDAFWGPGSGSPQNLAKAIFQIRQAVDGTPGIRIESIYGYGYRLRANESGLDSPGASETALAICDEAAHRVYDRRDIALTSALTMYEEASRLDPNCIPAYTGYAETHMQLMGTGQESPQIGWPAARQALEDALQQDSKAADAHALRALGQCLFDWDFDAALSSVEIALRLAPGAYVPNEAAGRISLFMGNPQDAVSYLRRAHAARPVAMNTRGILAYALGCSGDERAALDHVAEARRLDPGNPMSLGYSALIEAAYGNAEKACEYGAEVVNRVPRSATIAAVYAFALARAGHAKAARALVESLENKSLYATPCSAFTSHAWRALGDAQAAVRSLAAGVQERDYWAGMKLHDPLNAPLRTEPGFRDVYESIFGSGAK